MKRYIVAAGIVMEDTRQNRLDAQEINEELRRITN